MMLLQEGVSSGVQITFGGLLLANTGMLLKLVFNAGKLVERVDSHERRLDHLETVRAARKAGQL